MAFLLLGLAISCRKDIYKTGDQDNSERSSRADREEAPVSRRVLLLYSAGFNSLSTYLAGDIEEICNAEFVPGGKAVDNVLLVFSRLPVEAKNYTEETAPALFRVTRDSRGNVVRDTLEIPGFDDSTVASSAETMRTVLEYVHEHFPAASYGMIFSSHGTGWLPEGYYSNPNAYEGSDIWSLRSMRRQSGVPYYEPPCDPDAPAVKSIGQDLVGTTSHEIALKDFDTAIPMHLNYLIIDACLMGGIETAWELRDVVDTLAFSQTEILADGFDYPKIARRLLVDGEGGVLAACRDYFDQYDIKTGQERSATVSVIDLRKMDDLASVCAELFEKYRDEILDIDPSTVQEYFRFSRHWFYDFEDILLHAGISGEEQDLLSDALSQCVIYKAATPQFLSIPINHFSGLSMFLPSNGSKFLKNYYKENVEWNEATVLVN